MVVITEDDKARMEKKLYPTSKPPEQQPPPTYAANPPDLAAAFSNLTIHRGSPTPTPEQCIAHLKLLEAFHQLREDVATIDGLFGISDSLVSADEPSNNQRKILLRIREKRWAVYVARAASRFEKWWQESVQPDAVMISQKDLTGELPFTEEDSRIGSWVITRDQLPPLGMFDPSSFFGDSKVLNRCRCRHGMAFVYVEPKMLLGGLFET